MSAPQLTLLYVLGDRPDRAATAIASDADVVLVDLEDAVAPSHEEEARDVAARLLAELPASRPAQVRITHPLTPWHADDVAMLGALPQAVGAGAEGEVCC